MVEGQMQGNQLRWLRALFKMKSILNGLLLNLLKLWVISLSTIKSSKHMICLEICNGTI